MRYFYDTEFLDDGNTIELISIGIVAEDGREYYAVNSDFDQDRLVRDQWMCENVVPHLPLRTKVTRNTVGGLRYHWSLDHTSVLLKPKWVIANEVREFLLAEDEPELWAYYGAYDHVALAQLWGKMIHLPKGIPMWTHDIMTLIENNPSLLDNVPHDDEHHALADARWNKTVYEMARFDATTKAMKK